MATEQQLRQALIKADVAGDTVAANLFASKIKGMKTNVIDTNSGGMGVSSSNGLSSQPSGQGAQQVAEPEKGFLDSVGEFFTGSDRETQQTRDLPEIGQGGLLFGEDKVKAAAITPALLTATNPEEMGKILSSNFTNVGVTQDKEGNLFARNNTTGAQVVLNKPGFSQIDIIQGLGIASAFTPAGLVTGGAVKVAGAAGATSAGIEALQALSGGDFDASQVAIDTVTAGVLDKAFDVAKATNRSIRDVLRNDANIDPDQILKSFEPQGNRSRAFQKGEPKPSDVIDSVQKASQPDLTQEALQRIRQAERQGVQLSRAEATGDFNSAEAEQTLLKSISPEGDIARAFKENQQVELKGAAEAFTQKFGGSGRFKESLGEAAEDTARGKGELIQDALLQRKELGRQEVSDLYTLAGETAGDPLPLNNASIVDIADEVIVGRPTTKEVKDSINSTLAKFGLIGEDVSKAGRNKSFIFDGEDKVSFLGEQTPLTLNNAEQFRQSLNKAVAADQTGSAKLIVSELDKQIAQVIDGGVESGRTAAFGQARGAAKSQFETFAAKDVIEDLVSFKRGTSTPKVDPETVINKIVKGDKAVTNIRKLKQVLLESPTTESTKAWRSIQAETVGDILGQAINKDTLEISGARLNSAIKKYKPEALRELLGRKQLAELKNLQKVIGDATIPPPGTTNPSGTFTKFLNTTERLGNFAGFGQVNFGSLAMEGIKKGKDIAARKKTLDGLVNTKVVKLKKENPSLGKTALQKAALTLAFLEIRDLDKENK